MVLHGLKLLDGRYVTRIYGVEDNPKGTLEGAGGAGFLGSSLKDFLTANGIDTSELWTEGQEHSLWSARLYPAASSMEESVQFALLIWKMVRGKASQEERDAWRRAERLSLQSSFNRADVLRPEPGSGNWKTGFWRAVFLWQLEAGVYYKEALKTFGTHGIDGEIFSLLMEDAEHSDFSLKIRIFYAVAQYMKERRLTFGQTGYDLVEALCFDTIQKTIFDDAASRLTAIGDYRIAQDRVDVKLPVRVNWGGGWTDTPPHCNEQGGTVLNAALKLNGSIRFRSAWKGFPSCMWNLPARISVLPVTRTRWKRFRTATILMIRSRCIRRALIACGIVPLDGERGVRSGSGESDDAQESLQEICSRLGGGIRLSTKVVGIPQGSGLGTSSILSGACVKGLFRFLGREATDDEIYAIVLAMEQIMSTGGGWQDQVGGLTPGIKFITTKPGIHQQIHVEQVKIPEETAKELQERFALIYTGQRRLARNLLRDVVGGYLGGRPESIDALERMQEVAVLMRFELERGNLDAFAGLLNRHWELSTQLDSGSTNTCIEQIFLSCEDLIDARFIAGAGGGGFLQVLLKRGCTKEMLRERLHEIFQESGVDVWDTEFV